MATQSSWSTTRTTSSKRSSTHSAIRPSSNTTPAETFITEVDALGGTTVRTYDGANNMLTETDPLGNTTTFTYNGTADILTETDPLGNVTTFTYQHFNNFGLFATVSGGPDRIHGC